MGSALAPYRAAFTSRFQLLLQYRSAAVAGVVTQCWWGGLKVMILSAFYGASNAAASAPITLGQAITYTWLSQALLGLTYCSVDPELGQALRSGNIVYDRLRPVSGYAFWYARTAGWLSGRVLPRTILLFAFAALALPWLGLEEWAWRAPADVGAGLRFAVSLLLGVLLASAIVMLLNLLVLVTLDERGINALVAVPMLLLSGNVLPLPLLPDGLRLILLAQPFAGLIDIPLRLYSGVLLGTEAWLGLGLQLSWLLALVGTGRALEKSVLRRLEVQGG